VDVWLPIRYADAVADAAVSMSAALTVDMPIIRPAATNAALAAGIFDVALTAIS
jgi:hypothetical protein